MGHLSYKTKQFFFVVIKIGIIAIAFYFIYNKLIFETELELHTFFRFLRANKLFTFKTVIILLFLTILNWLFENLKWRTLVNSVTKITFKNAAEQSLGALTTSLFTPNRIGEYGAKAIYFKRQHRKSIVALNFLGNMMQMSMTVLFGVIGLFLFQSIYDTELLRFNTYSGLVLIVILTIIFLLFRHRNRFKIKGFSAEKLRWFYRTISKRVYILGLLFSLFRYLIFSFQFYMLLTLFESDLSYLNSMVIITTMYFLASIIPTVFIFDVVIKGSIALYLFTFAGINSLTILSVITLMWSLNFALPAIFGSYFVLNFRIIKHTD